MRATYLEVEPQPADAGVAGADLVGARRGQAGHRRLDQIGAVF